MRIGDYWHSEQMKGMPEDQHEQERIQLFENEGYQTLVVWEHELEDEQDVIERVMSLGSKKIRWIGKTILTDCLQRLT